MHMAAPPFIVPAGPAAAACCAPPAGIDPALDAERIAAAAKALAEPLRVQIVDVLRRSENDVCQCALIAVRGVHQSLLAYHIKKLTDVGLVNVERRHKWAYYFVSTDALQELSAWLR
jgi:ArsR family transcriptional regulator